MLRQLEGSRAVAETVARCRPHVVAAYPISPQTHIVEALSDLVASGELAPCEYLMVESEFGALSACIGASAAGARAYTATASQGLLFMAEALPNASGLGLPMVMTVANRALGAPINIWNDHSDALSQRDAGWLMLFASSNQEAVDLHVQAFALAERLSLPVMVCMDGFVLTHAVEEIDVPGQDQVDAFLPPFRPRQWLDPDEPVTIGAMVGPEAYTEVKYLMAHRQLRALDAVSEVADDFAEAFGRDSGGLRAALPHRRRRGGRRRPGFGAGLARRRRGRAARRGCLGRRPRGDLLPAMARRRGTPGAARSPARDRPQPRRRRGFGQHPGPGRAPVCPSLDDDPRRRPRPGGPTRHARRPASAWCSTSLPDGWAARR